jgi:pteridine reductase
MNPEPDRSNPRPVALITGAARRVGRIIAETLHSAGYDLALHYRASKADALALADRLDAVRAGSTLLLEADLSAYGELAPLVGRAAAHFGRLDALVNNASTFYPTAIGETLEVHWNDLFASNAKAPYFLAQAAAPHLRESHGAIVNLVDIYADRPLARHPVYAMAKAANAMMVKALARELGPEVRVNGVSPGAVMWPEAGKPPAEQQALLDRTALKRAGEAADVAGAVLYLLRDARYVTGQILAVDGGRSVMI